MAITGNEVEVANQVRRDEELSRSPVGRVIESGLPVAGAAVSLGTALVSGGSTVLVVAGSIVAASGIVDWFRRLGTSKVSENLEVLGQATEDALSRVENVLREHGTSIDEIKRRLESEDLKSAMASASLQALRTTQKDRLVRLSLVLANGLKENDLKPESTDDMMRAAVELKDIDLQVLNTVLDQQRKTTTLSLSTVDGIINQPIEVWRPLNQSGFFTAENHMEILTSLERLKSLGFCAEVQTMTPSWLPRALVTPLGEIFLKRVREIAT
jgi:DNA-binding transcriptional MerR regulator